MYLGVHAERHPERLALAMDDGAALTYGELEAESNRFARALGRLGTEPGDVVALMLENSLQWGIVYWGVMRSGRYLTAVNWHLAPEEVAYVLANSGAKVLVVGPATREVAAAAVVDLADLVVVEVGAAAAGSRGTVDFGDVLAAEPPSRLDRELAGGPMYYSSGTTGRPKGIKPTLTGQHPSEVASVAYVYATSFGMREGDRYLNSTPLYHSAPSILTFGAHAVGASSVVMPRFDARRALEDIERFAITVSFWVPTMFQRMLRLPEEDRTRFDLATHRLAMHAGAPCPPGVKRAMIEWWGPILLEFYGASEAGATLIGSEEWLARPGSVGRVWGAGTKLAVLDVESKAPLPPGREGLVYFEPLASHRFEYFGDPEKTAEVYHDGMVTAGDIGYLDEDGYLFLTDRLANTIVSGGVNIYPQEIEQVLVEHPAVADAAVFGIPDDEFGEQVKAVVTLVPGSTADPATAEELRDYCRGRLAGFKVPRTVDFADELPRGDNGKLYKRRLRDPYWAGRSSRIV